MSQCRVHAFTLALAMLAAASARADVVNWTAGDGPGPNPNGRESCKVDYDGKATIAWRECEGVSPGGLRSSFWSDCGAISHFLGDAKLACRYDKPSFQKHYDDVAKLKASDRSAAGDPANTAGMALKCFSDEGAAMSSVFYTFADSRKGKTMAEIRSKLKTITVHYDDKVDPNAALHGSELVLTVRTESKNGDGIGSGCGWITDGVLRAFPELKKEYDDHH